MRARTTETSIQSNKIIAILADFLPPLPESPEIPQLYGCTIFLYGCTEHELYGCTIFLNIYFEIRTRSSSSFRVKFDLFDYEIRISFGILQMFYPALLLFVLGCFRAESRSFSLQSTCHQNKGNTFRAFMRALGTRICSHHGKARTIDCD